MIRIFTFTLITLLVFACNAISGDSNSSQGSKLSKVTGTVTYRERIALTPDAVVEVQLLDVSLADTSAIQIATQTVRPSHQVPIPFELIYDPADIDERMTYAVRATIREGERLLFTTDRHYPVLTHGHSHQVDLVLVRIRSDV